MLTRSPIAKGLKALRDYVECSADADAVDEVWEQWLPDVSPKELYLPLRTASIGSERPHMTIDFDDDPSRP